MRKRTKARECALKILYSIDITKNDADEATNSYWLNNEEKDVEVRRFAEALVEGVTKHGNAIDKLLSKYTANWELKRMAVIDRNVLRFATYELLFASDVPPKVAINEAIDIVKKYGDKDSGKFVNGVLDKINKEERKTK